MYLYRMEEKVLILEMINLAPMYVKWEVGDNIFDGVVFIDFYNEKIHCNGFDLDDEVKFELLKIIREKKSQSLPSIPDGLISSIKNQIKKREIP